MKLREFYRWRRTLYVLALTAAVLAMAAVFAASAARVKLPLAPQALSILAVVAVFAVPGMVDVTYLGWRRKVDAMIPTLLSDVTSRVRTGFSLTRSLEVASESDYGPLTEELKRFRAHLSWGMTFEEAVKSLIERVDSQVVRRAFGILLEADRAGGKVEEMLEAVHKHISQMQEIEDERRATLRSYTVTIYASIFIFLIVAIILIDAFFSEVLSAQGAVGGGLVGFGGGPAVSLDSVKQAFLQIGLVEAVVGGLGAGKLGEGSVSAGTKHVVILVALTVAAFEVFAR